MHLSRPTATLLMQTSVAAFSRPHDGDAAAGEREKSDPIAARRFWLAQVVRVGVGCSYVWLRLIEKR